MTLAQSRAAWEKENPGGSWDSLTHDEQMEILTAAVKAERAKRKR